MRIITGIAKGKKLLTLDGLETRPTSAAVKEGLFSAIQFEIEGSRVLDLFAGSGAMGLEALSRGAKSAIFVDKNPEACKIIKQNLINTGLENKAIIKNTDHLSFIANSNEKFDLVFLDPPYKEGLLYDTVTKLIPLLSDNSIVICEHLSSTVLPEKIASLTIRKRYKYGKKIAASIFARSKE